MSTHPFLNARPNSLSTLSSSKKERMARRVERADREFRQGTVATQVTFTEISGEDLERYVATGEPRDKAGAYAIQGEGGASSARTRDRTRT